MSPTLALTVGLLVAAAEVLVEVNVDKTVVVVTVVAGMVVELRADVTVDDEDVFGPWPSLYTLRREEPPHSSVELPAGLSAPPHKRLITIRILMAMMFMIRELSGLTLTGEGAA